jgi:ABC-type branched-subunit amino acid transport system ATPase component
VLSAHGVTKRFGGLVALSDVSLEVPSRSIVGLVGPNGAGKSTLFAVLSGLLKPDEGTVKLGGDDVTGTSPQRRARMGLARTFQQPELFLSLNVREHLVLAHRMRFERRRLWKDMFDFGALLRSSKDEDEHVDGLLAQLGLTRLASASVAALPLGTSRLVEVGRALATSPSLLLLDEPLSGLDLKESEQLANVLSRVVRESDQDVSLLMVEHDVATVLALSDTIYVLDFGEVIASGVPDEIRQSEAVRAAYLGGEVAPEGGVPSETDVEEHS